MLLHPLSESATIRLDFMENSPDEKPLRSVSFIVHATRGIIRHQNTRRKTMFALLVVALLLLFAGSTFLAPILDPREHLGWALLFWISCIWLTLTALLLAFFDLVVVRAEARKAERRLRGEFSSDQSQNSPSARDRE